MNSISRKLVLKELDVKETPSGGPVIFSIAFIKNNGERVYYRRAVSCGLSANMSNNRLRGVLPVDEHGDSVSHPTPVHIDSIMEFNGARVKL